MSEEVSDEAPAGGEAEALTFEVSDEEAGARLDSFLAARVASASRTALKRAIEDGDVLVAGRAAKPSHRLRAGERVEVEELPAPAPSELTPEEIPLDVVYEDAEVVVVNKPAGMVVHPAAGVHSGTLANALAYRLRDADSGLRIDEGDASSADSARSGAQLQDTANPQSAIPNSQSLRPGIVHRLDRDTSGLVVVAKTAAAHESLSEQFRARTVFKSYVALVHGVVREEKGRVEQALARDPRHRTRMAVARGGRAALSLWRVRRRYGRFTLLDVEIRTGRTHQIRVHLAWMKHPVVGDETYGAGRDKTVADPALRARIAALGRQFLHAERLGFRQPRTGEWLSFTSPLPRELSDFLDALEAKRD
jgi:23S rRNA pseudouridine1911/1915/1917 synthase